MDIKALTDLMDQFVSQKGWYEQDSIHPQTPRSIAISLCLESAEVLEHFQWSEDTGDKEALSGELADVTLYLLQLARLCKVDLEKAVLRKLDQNYARHWE
jgi:NTP pyrophosphatase (non-canonical NTP hydrolase)